MTASKLDVELLVVGPLLSNCYIIWDNSSRVGGVIDPGGDSNTIIKTINKLNLDIKYIISTHNHFDHVGAVVELRNQTSAKFLAHKNDFSPINTKSELLPDRFIDEGDEILIGQFKLKILHTPGHSPGGICLYINKMVFVGDTIFQGDVGRCDLQGGSFDELKKSIINKLYVLPDDTIVYTGHGPITTIGYEKKYNAYVRA